MTTCPKAVFLVSPDRKLGESSKTTMPIICGKEHEQNMAETNATVADGGCIRGQGIAHVGDNANDAQRCSRCPADKLTSDSEIETNPLVLYQNGKLLSLYSRYSPLTTVGKSYLSTSKLGY